MPATPRYVYFISGHVRMVPQATTEPVFNLPFSEVRRSPHPITSPAELQGFIEGPLKDEISSQVQELTAEVDEVIVRTMTLLHTIMVDSQAPNEGPVRVLS